VNYDALLADDIAHLGERSFRCKAGIPRRRHRHPRDDPREYVGVRVGVGVVE